ncbi:MAG: TIGR00153 family protein [Desulfatibacillaceae bacterium]
MRIPFVNMFVTSPFEGMKEHADKVGECARAFQTAIECHISSECSTFDEQRKSIHDLENEADLVKRRVRGHLPKGTLLPVDKFQLFRYLREQDHVIDSAMHTLDWLSYRPQSAIPEELQKDYLLLVDAVLEPITKLSYMVDEARKYFETFNEKQRLMVKDIIRDIRQAEQQTDKIEDRLKRDIFAKVDDAVTLFHLVRLVEYTASIADHAENACDMMRAMIAR